MDVERIQKINSLAVDLMKQGLAQDREEAVAQAEKIFRSKDDGDYTSLRETMQSARPGSLALDSKTAAVAATPLGADEVKTILEQNTKFLVSKIREFQDKVAALEKEVSSLRTNIISQRMATVHSPAQVIIKPGGDGIQVPREAAAAPKPQSHPRSGNYTEGDVSIEKFFYAGK